MLAPQNLVGSSCLLRQSVVVLSLCYAMQQGPIGNLELIILFLAKPECGLLQISFLQIAFLKQNLKETYTTVNRTRDLLLYLYKLHDVKKLKN